MKSYPYVTCHDWFSSAPPYTLAWIAYKRHDHPTDNQRVLCLDVHFIYTLPVLVTSRHSRESGNPGGQEPWGLDACLRRHDVLLASDLRNRHLACWAMTSVNQRGSCLVTAKMLLEQQEQLIYRAGAVGTTELSSRGCSPVTLRHAWHVLMSIFSRMTTHEQHLSLARND